MGREKSWPSECETDKSICGERERERERARERQREREREERESEKDLHYVPGDSQQPKNMLLKTH